MSLGSTTETTSSSPLLCRTPAGMAMQSYFKTTIEEPFVHVLSKITYSFAESRLSHGQEGPQTCLQLNAGGTSSGDVSGDVLTSHRTSTSSLMLSRKSGAGSLKQPVGGSSAA